MNIVQLRAHGDRVETGDLLDEKAALKAAVGGFDLPVVAGEVTVDRFDLLAEGGIAVVLPAGIVAALAHGAAAEFDDGLHALDEHILLRGDAGADGEGTLHAVLARAHHAEVERGLHKTGEVGAHLLHALRQGKEHVQQSRRVRCGERGRNVSLFAHEGNAAVGDGVLIFERRVEFLDECLERGRVGRGERDERVVSQADDVVELSAREITHAQRRAALHRAIQRARHQAVGVAAALIDVHAGVAALETRDRHAVAGHIRRALLLEFERAVKAHAARAGHGKHALFLRVEVQKLFAL